MKNNIFIPKEIKVGFQHRENTYQGVLGYVIYKKGNEWKKTASWESWRTKYIESLDNYYIDNYNRQLTSNKKYYQSQLDNLTSSNKYDKERAEDIIKKYPTEIDYLENWNLHDFDIWKSKERKPSHLSDDKAIIPLEFKNIPIEGFVLNKKAGGYSSGWNHRATYCRVYDPRGFEFEITIDNLLYILENTTCDVGKGIIGKMVYGWDGKNLVLIPENASEFNEMKQFTELQSKSVKKVDLKEGFTYITKSNEKWLYLGRFHEYSEKYNSGNRITIKVLKHYFYNLEESKSSWRNSFNDKVVRQSGLTNIAELSSDVIPDNFNELLEELTNYSFYSPYDESKYVYEKATEDNLNSGNNYFKYNDKWYIAYTTHVDKNRYSYNQAVDKTYSYNWREYKTMKIDEYTTVELPHDLSPYQYIIQHLGGFYKQIKYLENGKKAK